MSFPAFFRESRAGFYDAFWPDEWAEVRAYRDGTSTRPYGKYGYRVLPDRWRGDTLVSFNTVFKTCFEEGDALPDGVRPGDENPYLKARKMAWLEGVSPQLIACFRRSYHCLANFMPLPWGLNQWRGFACDTATHVANPGLRDFPDLFFDQVRKWYLGSDDLDPLAREEFGAYRAYFDRYGEGEEGWQAYVRRNYLDGSFVDADDRINYLFDRGGGSEPSTEHLLAHVLPECPSQTLEFINNAFVCWERRADALARAAGVVFEELGRAGLLRAEGGQDDVDEECNRLDSFCDVLTIKDYGFFNAQLMGELAAAVGAKAALGIVEEDVRAFHNLAQRYDWLVCVREATVPLEGVRTQEEVAERLAAVECRDSVHRIVFDSEMRTYRLEGTEESGPLSYVAGELCRDGLCYEWDLKGREGEYHFHDHDFEDVLRSVLQYPERFFVPDECKDQYSAQQLRFIERFQAALLAPPPAHGESS